MRTVWRVPKKIDGPVLLNTHYAFLREFGHIEDKF